MLYIQKSWQKEKNTGKIFGNSPVCSVSEFGILASFKPSAALTLSAPAAYKIEKFRLKNFKTFSITCIFQSFKFEPWLFSHKMLSGERQGHCWEGLLLLPYCGDAFPLPSRLLGSSACALSPKITSLEKIIPFFFKIIIKRISAFALLSLSSLSFHNSSLCCVVDWL